MCLCEEKRRANEWISNFSFLISSLCAFLVVCVCLGKEWGLQEEERGCWKEQRRTAKARKNTKQNKLFIRKKKKEKRVELWKYPQNRLMAREWWDLRYEMIFAGSFNILKGWKEKKNVFVVSCGGCFLMFPCEVSVIHQWCITSPPRTQSTFLRTKWMYSPRKGFW